MFIPKNWRLKQQRYQLQGATDEAGQVEFPPRPAVKQRSVDRYDLSPSDTAEAHLQELAS